MNKEQIAQLKMLMAEYKSADGGKRYRIAEQLVAYLDGCLSGILTFK